MSEFLNNNENKRIPKEKIVYENQSNGVSFVNVVSHKGDYTLRNSSAEQKGTFYSKSSFDPAPPENFKKTINRTTTYLKDNEYKKGVVKIDTTKTINTKSGTKITDNSRYYVKEKTGALKNARHSVHNVGYKYLTKGVSNANQADGLGNAAVMVVGGAVTGVRVVKTVAGYGKDVKRVFKRPPKTKIKTKVKTGDITYKSVLKKHNIKTSSSTIKNTKLLGSNISLLGASKKNLQNKHDETAFSNELGKALDKGDTVLRKTKDVVKEGKQLHTNLKVDKYKRKYNKKLKKYEKYKNKLKKEAGKKAAEKKIAKSAAKASTKAAKSKAKSKLVEIAAKGVSGFIKAACASGGGIVLLIFILFLILVLACSPAGLFVQADHTYTELNVEVGNIMDKYHNEISDHEAGRCAHHGQPGVNDGFSGWCGFSADVIEYDGDTSVSWRDVFSVYYVENMEGMEDKSGNKVCCLDINKAVEAKSRLEGLYHEMNSVRCVERTVSHTVYNQDTKQYEIRPLVTRIIKLVTTTAKNYAIEHDFTKEQKDNIDQLMSKEMDSYWAEFFKKVPRANENLFLTMNYGDGQSIASVAVAEYKFWEKLRHNPVTTKWPHVGSKYCDFVGHGIEDWCCNFATYCICTGLNIRLNQFKKTVGFEWSALVEGYRDGARSKGMLHSSTSNYTPKAGDLAIDGGYRSDGTFDDAMHIKVVTGTVNGRVYVVGGNENGYGDDSWCMVSTVSSYNQSKFEPVYYIETSKIGTSVKDNPGIWRYLHNNLGYSKVCTAAIMGNLAQEVGFDDNGNIAATNPANDGTDSDFICQWNDGRKQNLIKQYGSHPTIAQQLNFLKWECVSGGEWFSSNYMPHGRPYSYNDFLNETSISVGTVAFEECFERAGIPMNENRISYANSFYNKYKNLS